MDERASIRTESFGASVDDGRTDGRRRRSEAVVTSLGSLVCVRVERRADEEDGRTDARFVSFRFVSFRASKVR